MSASHPPRPAHPRAHLLADLAALLGVEAEIGTGVDPTSPEPVRLTGVAHAAQTVRPGDLYVARAGASAHGADFAAEAVARGAVAVLTDPAGRDRARAAGVATLVVDDPRAVLGTVAVWIYDDPAESIALIGITGTNGKTTTAYLVEAGLRAAGESTGLLGTVETRIGGDVVKSIRTTPEAPELQALFATMRERGVTAAVMEVSSHALALGRVDGTRFAVGVFTNLSQDHLDFHADMEDYFAAKARLFDGRCAAEVVNTDDPWGRRLVRDTTVTASPGGDPGAAWRAVQVQSTAGRGTTFTAEGPGGVRVDVALDLPGAFNVANALLALAAVAAAGVDPARAAPGLRHVTVPGRLERVDAGQTYLAFVDYAHKPGAVAAILEAVRPLTTGRLIIVLGCGGDRDRGKRPLMGEAAARGADLVIVTDDNPRSEDPATIRAAMEDGVRRVPGAHWLTIAGRADAIAEAVRQAGPGDTVVVAGKGHEQGQEIAGEIRPFDDRCVLRDAIRADAR